MPLLTPGQFSANYTADARATTGRIEYALNRAKKRLVHYVGAAAVADYVSDAPTDTARADDFWHAHGHFAYAILAGSCGSTLREGGKLKREGNVMGDTTAEYETFEQVKGWIDYQNDLAMELINPYLTPAEVVEANIDYPGTTFAELEIVY